MRIVRRSGLISVLPIAAAGFLAPMAFAQASISVPSGFSASFSVPEGIEGAYQQRFGDSRWSLRASIGGWPLERAWPGSLSKTNDVGDTYSFQSAPRLYMLTSSAKAEFRPSADSSFQFSAGFEFWMIHAGALVSLKNRDTGDSVMVAELEARWWQPLLSVGMSWQFATRWMCELSIGYRLGGGLRSDMQGPLPALEKVAPEYADAMTDGTLDAEKTLSSGLNDALHRLPIIPSIGVRYGW